MSKGNRVPPAQQGKHSASGKSVAKVEEAGVPAVSYDYGDYAGAGFEETTRDDFSTPMIYILQSNSPIVEKGEVDAARPGVLINSATQELYPADKAKAGHNGVAFIPCYTKHAYVEWKPNRGGFVAEHPIDSPVVAKAKASGEFGKLKVGENELQETFYIFGLLLKGEDAEPEMVIVPFTSTKIKPYKKLMTRLNAIRVNGRQVPLFAHRVRIQTERQENDSGAFFNFVAGLDGDNRDAAAIDPKSDLFKMAAEFYENCRSGIAKPNYQSAEREPSANVGSDEEIPF